MKKIYLTVHHDQHLGIEIDAFERRASALAKAQQIYPAYADNAEVPAAIYEHGGATRQVFVIEKEVVE